jgi:hypothetical protein
MPGKFSQDPLDAALQQDHQLREENGHISVTVQVLKQGKHQQRANTVGCKMQGLNAF